MSLNSQGINELQRQREQHLIDAARLLLQENNADGAAQALQKIKTGDELLALCSGQSMHRLFPLAAVAICLAVVSCLVTCHQRDPSVRLKLETQTAMLTLTEKSAWKWKPYPVPAAENILIEGIFGIEAPPGLSMSGAAEKLAANGKNITLEYIAPGWKRNGMTASPICTSTTATCGAVFRFRTASCMCSQAAQR